MNKFDFLRLLKMKRVQAKQNSKDDGVKRAVHKLTVQGEGIIVINMDLKTIGGAWLGQNLNCCYCIWSVPGMLTFVSCNDRL